VLVVGVLVVRVLVLVNVSRAVGVLVLVLMKRLRAVRFGVSTVALRHGVVVMVEAHSAMHRFAPGPGNHPEGFDVRPNVSSKIGRPAIRGAIGAVLSTKQR
jgi:hypothetical protein